ncbi:MAG: hypothetical protein FWF05_01720 [Oscillospiraceae bacterium]|nr:hypothetical protein [Oscillospiraceae bacterium]
MKKTIAILLAVISVFGCLTVFAFAEETDTAVVPQVGDVLAVGAKIKSGLDANKCDVIYTINSDDAGTVTSALGSKVMGALKNPTEFFDEVFNFQFSEENGGRDGVYDLLGIGGSVMKILTEKGYLSATEIGQQLNLDIAAINIDYVYNETTYYSYYSLSGWKVIEVNDSEYTFAVKLEAQWTAREQTGTEEIVEAIYAQVMAVWNTILDILGNGLMRLVPQLIKGWADVLRGLFAGA